MCAVCGLWGAALPLGGGGRARVGAITPSPISLSSPLDAAMPQAAYVCAPRARLLGIDSAYASEAAMIALWGARCGAFASQMVAVYDVVEIAGISYGMISKSLAYDLNRNHTM